MSLGDVVTRFWDWIDKRDIDKHAISVSIMYGTWSLTHWAMTYAIASSRPGIDLAVIIAAVTAPYVALQAAALKWYFDARSS